MAFKRSGVRLPLSPPHEKTNLEFVFFFCVRWRQRQIRKNLIIMLRSNYNSSVSESKKCEFELYSLRSNYSSRCSHYSQNKFGILLSKNLAKVNAMRSSIFHQLPLLRVANLITYFTLRETVFRGPLSSNRLLSRQTYVLVPILNYHIHFLYSAGLTLKFLRKTSA